MEDSKMKINTPKSIRTLASDLKASRKRKLTAEQIDRLNKVFEEIEKEQQKEARECKAENQCDSF
jgi:hypothetical protein